MRFTLVLFILALAGVCACQTAKKPAYPAYVDLPLKPGELPVKAFAALPLYEDMTWSPNGMYQAFLQNSAGKTALITEDRSGSNMHIVLVTDNTKYSIRDYSWVNNERLLINIAFYTGETDIKYIATRIFAINRDGTEEKPDLLHFAEHDHFSAVQDAYTKLPNDDRHVLIALDKRNAGAPDVYKLDVYSGELELLETNHGYVRTWIYDQQGNVRIGIGVRGTRRVILYHAQHDKDDDWQTLADYEATQEGPMPLGFGEDPNILYLLASHQGKKALFKSHVNQPKAPAELVFADPNYDVNGKLLYSTDKQRVVGVTYLADKPRAFYLDKDAANFSARLGKLLPNIGFHVISSWQNKHLLLASGPQLPPVYYEFDEHNNTLSEIAKVYPELSPALLSKTEKITVQARDGLPLEAYLTKPSSQAASPGPAIILPHGGPWSRDTYQFDIWTQFLANRGWTVLQLNFRGSTGYGEAFLKAGFKRWGLEMQDDITDGVQWLIANKIADPAKVCIVGASYGGYAALMGLSKTPELYRCGVSFAPVTDLQELVDDRSDRRYLDSELNEKLAETHIGDWWSDRARLQQTSPVNLAGRFSKPLLLVHGVKDVVVPVKHSRNLVSEFKDAGFKDYTYLELETADHHLSRAEDRMAFFQALDVFLRKYQ